MTQTERRTIRQAIARLQTGDRSGAREVLAALVVPRGPGTLFGIEGQLALGFVTFNCTRLAVNGLPAHICVTRQKVTDAQRTQQASRGQGTDYPLCDSRTCEQGRRVRLALDPAGAVRWRGAGPGGRFAKDRPAAEREAQRAVRERMRLAGMLDEVPTLDAMPGEVEE